MTRVALKGIASRKLRSLLTGLAVVLGVALVSGTYVLTDSIEQAFGSILTSSYEQTDAVVTPGHAERMAASGETAVSAALLEHIRALPEVEEAVGTMIDFWGGSDPTTLRDRHGHPIDNNAPTFGFGIASDAERFNPLDLAQGRWALREGEVVIDAETASRYGYSLGDRIGVRTLGPTEGFTIVGVARLGDVATIGGASIAVFDLETAQRLHGKDGFYTIAVAAADGVPAERLVAAIRSLVPAGVTVRTGEGEAAQALEEASFVRYVRYFLLAFGGITLLVGAFVIVNTLSITVTQRTREFATLRMLGASRRQVHRSVVLEGLASGVLASVAGLLAGFGLAEGLSAVLGALGLALPEGGTVFRARTVVVSLAAGIGVTLIATLIPAARATRVSPLEAVRESRTSAANRQSRRVTGVAIALLAIGAAGVAAGIGSGSSESGLLLVMAGGVAAFAGTGMVAPRLARPLVALLGRPLALIGGPAARLARENAARNPTRTAATAAALMIGMTVATFAAVIGHGIVTAGERGIREQIRTNHIVASAGASAKQRADLARRLATAPGITAAASIRTVMGGATLDSSTMVGVSGVDEAAIARVYRFDWQQGSDATPAQLGTHGALIDSTLAARKQLAVGDPLVLRTRDGRSVETMVRGLFSPAQFDSLLGQVVVTSVLFDRGFPTVVPTLTLVQVAEADAVELALRAVSGAELQTPAELAESRNRELMSVLRLLYVLLAMAVLVSLLGMVNTLVLAVLERTREIAMLRAIGMTRRQVRRMVRHEGVLTALLGAALGVPLGIGLAAAVSRTSDDASFGFSLPVETLAVFAGVTVAVGLAAAALPARRASRLNVLEALQYE